MTEASLYQQLTEQIGGGESALLPRIFAALITDSEARLLLAAAPPATIGELADRTGFDTAAIEAMIAPLFRKGLLFKSKKPDGIRYYRVRHVPQFHDATASVPDPPPALLDLWREYTRGEWVEQRKFLQAVMPPEAAFRVVPINVTLEPEAQVLTYDDLNGLIAAATTIAVTTCTCRVILRSCDKPVDVCLQLDRAAEYHIERGSGRRLSREEALRILELCEAEGLVHVAENRPGVGNVICNCCRDCCLNWTPDTTGLGKFIQPSRFRAVVEAETCNGCELCIDRCFFEALHMVEGGSLAAVDTEKCLGCGVCRAVCAMDAIRMQLAPPREGVAV